MTKRERKYHRQKKAGYGFRSRTYRNDSNQSGRIVEMVKNNDPNSPFYLPPGDHFSNFGILMPIGVERNVDGSEKKFQTDFFV